MHLPIGHLRQGVTPADVLREAADALSALHVVESKDVEAPLVAGRRIGRVVLRFGVEPSSTADEDAAARAALAAVVAHLEERVGTIAPASAVVLTRGHAGRFRPIPPSAAQGGVAGFELP